MRGFSANVSLLAIAVSPTLFLLIASGSSYALNEMEVDPTVLTTSNVLENSSFPDSEPFPVLENIPDTELQLPPLEQLFDYPLPPRESSDIPGRSTTLCVRDFTVTGTISAFNPEKLIRIARESAFMAGEETNYFPPEYSCSLQGSNGSINGYQVAFADLLRARDAITQHYIRKGYVTSGAFIPEQVQQQGLIEIRVLEGTLEAINVSGNQRLSSSYVINRLASASSAPLNQSEILDGLRLLQQDPLIENISSRLSAGSRAGQNILSVDIQEADTFGASLLLTNDRPISVGSFGRELLISERNLLGIGDSLSTRYSNTDGGNTFGINYNIPVNSQGGRVDFGYRRASNAIIQPEFEVLGIRSRSYAYEFYYRQPLVRTPSEELTIGIGTTLRQNQLTFDFLGQELPLGVVGSDTSGTTRIFALRLTQEWTQRSTRQVFSARSQLSLGLDAFGATINSSSPDGRFVSWLGQTQWIHVLDRDMLLILRGNLQLADRPLVPMEQISMGGRQSARGYRQNALTTDNGFTSSIESRLPIYRNSSVRGILHLIPFLDFSVGWSNSESTIDSSTLISTGFGIGWQQGETFSARVDFGFPLTSGPNRTGNSLQENGIHFSIQYTPL